MNALLSIKPEFGEKILEGEKQYEFRKSVFSDPSAVEKVILYASSPVQRIIGYFSIGEIYQDTPIALWEGFGDASGIDSREQFLSYFSGKEEGYAIEIDETTSLETPVDPREHLDDFRAPMSFTYVNGEFDFVLDSSDSRIARESRV